MIECALLYLWNMRFIDDSGINLLRHYVYTIIVTQTGYNYCNIIIVESNQLSLGLFHS